MKPIDPERPALLELPIFDEAAKSRASSIELILDASMDRTEAMLRFLSGNLRVGPAEMIEMGKTLKDMMTENEEHLRLAFAYYAGVFDGVLLAIAQTECDRERKRQ